MHKIKVGDIIRARSIRAVHSSEVFIPAEKRTTHLQFRRYAACPVCNLHLRDFVKRHGELVAQGIQEVVVFYSSSNVLRAHLPEAPFALIADPERLLYQEFGVETSTTSLTHPASWLPAIRGVLNSGPKLPERDESVLGLPADFLIGSDGNVLALKYGVHAYDQWSFNEVVDLANSFGRPCAVGLPG